jgi:ankyrin repeat protein
LKTHQLSIVHRRGKKERKKERMNSIDRELIAAANENNLPEVERLLSVGADVHAKGYGGDTLLHMACYSGHVQVFQALREHGADIEATNNRGFTPLHDACTMCHLSVVIELLSPNDTNGATSRGANIEAKDIDGNTPLHRASRSGLLPVVKALVSGGANILARNNDGRPPIHDAVRRGKSEVAKYLFQEVYATTRRLPLHELLQDLTCSYYPDRTSVNDPPLRYALHLNVLGTDDVVEILEYLVDQNHALLSSRDRDGSLPLHVACRHGASFTIVQSLVNHFKGSVKSLTSEGDLPLFLACEMPKTSLDTIFLLIKLYPDLIYHPSL